jgi:hypothetical protein
MITFTDINTGNAIVLPTHSVQEAFAGEGMCRIITIAGIEYDVSDTWAEVLSELTGGGPPT